MSAHAPIDNVVDPFAQSKRGGVAHLIKYPITDDVATECGASFLTAPDQHGVWDPQQCDCVKCLRSLVAQLQLAPKETRG